MTDEWLVVLTERLDRGCGTDSLEADARGEINIAQTEGDNQNDRFDERKKKRNTPEDAVSLKHEAEMGGVYNHSSVGAVSVSESWRRVGHRPAVFWLFVSRRSTGEPGGWS